MLIEKYKWGQGKNTRLYSAVALAVIAAIGCWILYQKLAAAINITEAIGLWISITVPLGLFALTACFALLVCQQADSGGFPDCSRR